MSDHERLRGMRPIVMTSDRAKGMDLLRRVAQDWHGGYKLPAGRTTISLHLAQEISKFIEKREPEVGDMIHATIPTWGETEVTVEETWSGCCGAPIIEDTDFCSKCHDHA